jgi:hypothetical protein
VPEPEELTKSSDDDKKLNCDSYLSPAFLVHPEIVALRRLIAQGESQLKRNLDFTP